jgi:drug/metabolite transporter (DMT)-like permease
MAAALALASAFFYALKSVLQQRAAAAVPPEHSMRPRLLLHLARRPLWVVGTLTDGVAFLLHALALERGSLVLVQPLLVSSLLFALPLEAAWSKEPLERRHWLGAVLVVGGLSTFLILASPERGRARASGPAWAVLLVATLAAVGLLVHAARGRHGPARALWLAAAAGVTYGVIAALIKATASLFDAGVGAVLTAWEPYALVAVGGLGLLLGQSAFQAAPLGTSLPTLIALDPVASIAIGATLFGESVATGGLRPPLEAGGLVAMVVGIFLLARPRADEP